MRCVYICVTVCVVTVCAMCVVCEYVVCISVLCCVLHVCGMCVWCLMYVHVCMCVHSMLCMWKSEDKPVEFGLSCHWMWPVQVLR